MEQYMDICKILYDERMEGRVGKWSGGWFEGMMDELYDGTGNKKEVFSYFLPTWGLHYVLKTNAPDTAGDWAMIPGPVPYSWGGTWIAAYKNTRNAAAAKEFIRYIAANDRFLERYARDKGDFVTSIPVMQRIKNGYSDSFLAGQNYYAVFADIAENVNGRLSQQYDDRIEDMFREEVSAYVYGEKTKAGALADFRSRALWALPREIR